MDQVVAQALATFRRINDTVPVAGGSTGLAQAPAAAGPN